MHRLALLHLAICGVLVTPAATWAQHVAQAAAAAASNASVSQAPAPAPAQAPAPATDLDTRSLFEPRANQAQISGRFSSIDGDPARYQRYQDLRDGLLFTDARYARDDPGGAWLFRAAADNVGWRDGRYAAEYQRTGHFVVSGMFDQIPQFYSVDTKTPYSPSPSPLVLDNAAQLQAQTGGGLNVYVPIATQFDLRERRDIGTVNLVATPRPTLDLTANFTTQRHVGELPWGAGFGFSNDVEVALPYDSRTNDFNLGAEWTNNRQMLRVAYTGSWFNNLDDTLEWDSPLRLTDSTTGNNPGPGRGRMALWPSNTAQTVSAAGYSKFAHRTQLTGFVSFGSWSNNEQLQPFTINPTLPQLTLPRSTAEAEASVFSTNLNLVSRPIDDWRFSARVRHYGYDNQVPATPIPQFINYDTSVTTSSTGGPRPYAHDRTNFDADATWTGVQPVAINVGYSRNNTGHEFRIFESTGEDVFRLSADAFGTQWVTFRAEYELSGRDGSGLDESLLAQTGEQPAMRHYDVANRTRNRFTGQVDILPNDLWIFSASLGAGQDDYDDSYFGLQESTFRTFTVSGDLQRPDGWRAGASYTYERYSGFQQSRNASPGQENDPLRDWTADSRERVNYFSIYAAPPRFRQNTEARVSYDYSYAEGSYLYAIQPGSPITPPNQLPNVYNKLQQFHLDVRHKVTNQWVATFSYLYEPFRVYDFAFDPTVVNGIAQPSSLVLGYVYRPYTAHSFVLGARYFW